MRVYGVGRLVREMEIIYTEKAICVVKFTLAENLYNYKTKDKEAQFYDVVAFGKLAERLGNLQINKGEKLQIEGTLQIKNYINKEGNKRKYTQIILSGFELCGSRPKA